MAGRFDEDTYARARRFVESGGKSDEEESPKPKAKSAAKAKPASRAAPAVPGRPRGEDAGPPPAPSSTGIRRNPLGEMFAGEETRSRLRSEPDVSKEEIAAAKAAGDARRAKIAEQDKGVTNWLKRTFGTKAMREEAGYKKGGAVKKYAKGGSVKGDGVCQRGKTKGTMR